MSKGQGKYHYLQDKFLYLGDTKKLNNPLSQSGFQYKLQASYFCSVSSLLLILKTKTLKLCFAKTPYHLILQLSSWG